MPLSSPCQGAATLPLENISEAGAATAPVSARADRLRQAIVCLGGIELHRSDEPWRMSEIEDDSERGHEPVPVGLRPALSGCGTAR